MKGYSTKSRRILSQQTIGFVFLVATLCSPYVQGQSDRPSIRWSIQQTGPVKGMRDFRGLDNGGSRKHQRRCCFIQSLKWRSDPSIDAHTNGVNQVAFSPDNLLLASTSDDRTLKVWKVEDGSLVRTFTHTSFLYPVVFSPDSRLVYTGGGNGFIRSWNVQTGTTARSFPAQTASIWSLDLSYDGALLVTGSGTPDNRVRLWNAPAGASIRSMTGHTGEVMCLRFSPDGTKMVSASKDKTLRVWNAETGQARAIRDATSEMYAVDYSPDSQYVAAGSHAPENILRFWFVANLAQLAVTKAYTQEVDAVNCLRFSKGGHAFVYGLKTGCSRMRTTRWQILLSSTISQTTLLA